MPEQLAACHFIRQRSFSERLLGLLPVAPEVRLDPQFLLLLVQDA
jgi:hypothetical protein